MVEYDKLSNGDIPKVLKLVMVFIDRVGFPTLAFILMFYLSTTAIGKITDAVNRVSESVTNNAKMLLEIKTSSQKFEERVCEQHSVMVNDIKSLMLRQVR